MYNRSTIIQFIKQHVSEECLFMMVEDTKEDEGDYNQEPNSDARIEWLLNRYGEEQTAKIVGMFE